MRSAVTHRFQRVVVDCEDVLEAVAPGWGSMSSALARPLQEVVHMVCVGVPVGLPAFVQAFDGLAGLCSSL